MKYRKKPVIIDAFRIGYDKVMPDWFMDRVTANVITPTVTTRTLAMLLTLA